MTAQKGHELLLKLDIDGSSTFAAVAGLRSRRLAFNSTTVDVTNGSSANKWRELLQGAGVKSASLSGSGVFRDDAADETIRSLFFSGTVREWQVVVPALGTITGNFQISSLEFAGEHDGEVTYELALESAGELSFSV